MIASSDRPPGIPRLHIVTDDGVLSGSGFAATAAELMGLGAGRLAFHLRGPGTNGRDLWRHASWLKAVASETGSLLIVNDRLDVAIACGADGVQLGRRSFEIADARALVGSEKLIGASVHDAEEAADATLSGADFLIAGTLYRSGSHPDLPGSGVSWVRALDVGIPVIGIGGVTPARVPEVLASGASGVAVIGAIWSAPSPIAMVVEFLDRLEHSDGP